jgi:hypothetical protein
MSDKTVVEFGPRIRRRSRHNGPKTPLQKAELKDIAASETLILATAMGEVVLRGFEMKERRKLHRYLLLIAGGLAVLIGLVKTAIILINH